MKNFSSLKKGSNFQLLRVTMLIVPLAFFLLFQNNLLAEAGKNVNTTAILENYTVDSVMNTLATGVVVKDNNMAVAGKDIRRFDKEFVSSMDYYPPQFDSLITDLDSSMILNLPSKDNTFPIIDLPSMGGFSTNPNENLFSISGSSVSLGPSSEFSGSLDNPNTVVTGHPGLWDPSAPTNDPSDPLVHPVRVTEVEPVPEGGDCCS